MPPRSSAAETAGQSAGRARPRAQLAGQARLADPRLAPDHRRGTGPRPQTASQFASSSRSSRSRPRSASNPGRDGGGRRRSPGAPASRPAAARPDRGSAPTAPRRARAAGARPAFGRCASRRRDRRRRLESLDQSPVSVLVEPIAASTWRRVSSIASANLASLLGCARQLLEQLDHPLAVTVSGGHRPVVLEPLEQVSPA